MLFFENKILNQAIREVPKFEELLHRFERTISVLGRSQSTFSNYARHVASMALHFGKIPTELDVEQVQEYLFMLQKRSKTPSQTYFKHCVYGLRFLLKSEGLPYEYLHLPSIKHDKKLPTVLSKEEVWRLLNSCQLLKHRMLIGLLYGCGLRCMEARNVRLQDLDFDREQLKVVQGKGKKDRYVPLSKHLIRGLKTYIEAEKPKTYLLTVNHKAEQAEISIVVIPNEVYNGQLNKPVKLLELLKRFACIHFDILLLPIYLKTDSILSR